MAGDKGSGRPGGVGGAWPRWLALSVFVLFLMVIVLLAWQALRGWERDQIEDTIAVTTDRVTAEISVQMETRILALDRMTATWGRTDMPDEEDWKAELDLLFRDYPGYRAVAWVDPEFREKRVASDRDESVKRADLTTDEQAALKRARVNREALLVHPFDLADGEKGFSVYVPFYDEGNFDGYIVGVFEAQDFSEKILTGSVAPGYSVAVSHDGGRIFGRGGEATGLREKWGQDKSIDLSGATWRVQVWPGRATLERLQSPLPEATLAGGMVMAALLAFAVYLAQVSRQHAGEARKYNRRLEEEMAERKRYEEELRRSNAELQQFAYVASHDLQEPLRMVSSYVQLLARRYEDRLDGDAREFIAYAVDGAERMQGLINALLKYSRVGTRGGELVPMESGEAFEAALANLKVAVEEGGARVEHGPLPVVVGDASQLMQLFQNLIGNAIKFRGKDAPVVRVKAERRGERWVFSVADNGIGVEPDQTERIFQIFQRLHGRGEYAGTGIGLAVCKRIVERHGGEIWVESEPGEGSTFYFTLRAVSRDEGDDPH